jgi:hypothetical protein
MEDDDSLSFSLFDKLEISYCLCGVALLHNWLLRKPNIEN